MTAPCGGSNAIAVRFIDYALHLLLPSAQIVAGLLLR
jgi:hypothetical protein